MIDDGRRFVNNDDDITINCLLSPGHFIHSVEPYLIKLAVPNGGMYKDLGASLDEQFEVRLKSEPRKGAG